MAFSSFGWEGGSGVPSVASSGKAGATGMGECVDAIAETAACRSAPDGRVPRALVLLAICPEDLPGASAWEELRLLVRRKSSGQALPPVLAVVAIRANRARTIADAPTKAPGRGAPASSSRRNWSGRAAEDGAATCASVAWRRRCSRGIEVAKSAMRSNQRRNLEKNPGSSRRRSRTNCCASSPYALRKREG